jgi:hypothetical protein
VAPWAVIGWREWVELAGFGGAVVKAKVDTGARSSALHATEVEVVRRVARFRLHPEQRRLEPSLWVEAPVVGERDVRSSNGTVERRVVVRTPIRLGSWTLEVELTLTDRKDMGFRMLLGRAAIRHHFTVDPGSSYRLGRRVKTNRHHR